MFCIRLRHCVEIMTSFGVRVMTMFGYSLNPPPPLIMPRTSTTAIYGSVYDQPGTINLYGPEYGQPGAIKRKLG